MRRVGKGERKYREWRQGWLSRQAKKAEPDGLVQCQRCPTVKPPRTPPVARLICEDGHWKIVPGYLIVGHKQGRLSHADKKMSDDGVEFQCIQCNNEMSGNYYKKGEPQWSR